MKKFLSLILTFTMLITTIAIPVSAFAETSGQLTDNIFWNYNTENKTLTISGSGKMPATGSLNFKYLPWYEYLDEIKNS